MYILEYCYSKQILVVKSQPTYIGMYLIFNLYLCKSVGKKIFSYDGTSISKQCLGPTPFLPPFWIRYVVSKLGDWYDYRTTDKTEAKT
jgi:hypothetical protein